MKKQITLFLFVAFLSAIYVDASRSNGISESVSQQESVTTPDFTGTYVMYHKTTRTESYDGYGIGLMHNYFSDSTYVNVTIEKDSLTENQYIIKQFGRKQALDLTATYNPETGNLEIAHQPIFSNRVLVNVDNHDAPITLTPTADGFIINETWGSLYENGDYYEQGSNSVLMKPNAIMEWDNELNNSPTVHKREYVRVEQEGNSSEMAIVNFCNYGKRIIINLLNDTTFMIPPQLVFHFVDLLPDGLGGYFEMGESYCYLNGGYVESNPLPITGKWTSTTMISDGPWRYGGNLSNGNESPFTLTMLSETIVSPFVTSKPGDVNGDGSVNVSDVTYLVNMILGVIPKDETACDVNGDGIVNVSDVTALVNIILGVS